MNDLDIFTGAPQGATAAELAAYLDEACGSDEALRADVEALFASQRNSDGFMGRKPLQDALASSDSPEPNLEAPGSVIGNYKLLREIGAGGFGSVFLAEQSAPVQRRVALKVVKPGMDSREVIARFDAERQALAIMDHPNIARVYDAGLTPAGRPYFVMELVSGSSITDYCDEHKLRIDERVELLIEVCRAVHHAHRKGIIHRDIKPSNVMVTAVDGAPVVKVIDFGVAKATQTGLAESTFHTRIGQAVGTPAYMSPEQTRTGETDIDTRSDVYSLGILLYELLAGRPPFDPKRLGASGYDEMKRVIQEDNPPIIPSSILAAMGGTDLDAVAERRRTDRSALRLQLRGELDWIVMKAIEKDRARRYDTASDLAEDLLR